MQAAKVEKLWRQSDLEFVAQENQQEALRQVNLLVNTQQSDTFFLQSNQASKSKNNMPKYFEFQEEVEEVNEESSINQDELEDLINIDGVNAKFKKIRVESPIDSEISDNEVQHNKENYQRFGNQKFDLSKGAS